MSTEGIGGFLGESSIESLNSGAEGRVADPVVVSSVTGGHGGHGQEAAECRGYVIICKWGPLCVINSFPVVRKGIREEEQYKIGTF